MEPCKVFIHAFDGVCALGEGREYLTSALLSEKKPSNDYVIDSFTPNKPIFLGRIFPEIQEETLPKNLPIQFLTKINALLYRNFQLIKPQWQTITQSIPKNRIAVILGSSNAGIESGENAIEAFEKNATLPENYRYQQQEYGNPAQFMAWLLEAQGPAYIISTACSSSAKAFISGARLLQQNLCDVVLVGGADVLSQLTAGGFLALDAIDGGRCQPFSAQRKGIHLGEASALFIMTRQPSELCLKGWGEASDAHHMAAPHPEGLGAESCMRKALTRAELSPSDIDYLNLHGTATLQNDAMEAIAVDKIFKYSKTQMSSTKPLTGHTLGAAGAIEALFCCLTLMQNKSSECDEASRLPIHWMSGKTDDSLPQMNFVTADSNTTQSLNVAMTNSFGFGGSNACLIFTKEK
ncbi:beta-ketoacyl-ACP synthase [Hydromonas duriensis]|uniref:3-oxoacyl-[acyl-carrier-protein] synthase-1 n=1 Tax=Hydromonas duriensis TaxID=1527608 RepID=A0A4R6Y5M0_9BURK|nr:beta-ketoacyl-ACP synthase [Hydromonas duriensis]TDR30738.1 3-oxoacyl-[acyl-carrier-protein] synthase-1 [Hydromonas duriensis]